MGLWSPSRLTTDVPSKPKSPAVPIPSPVPSEPAPWLAPRLGHVGRFDVYPVHQLCARGKPRALASLGFLTSKSGGLWRVCSRTRAMPLGRFHQRRLSLTTDSVRLSSKVLQGVRGKASVVSVSASRTSRSSPLCWLLLVGLRSIRPAAIVTDAGYTDPNRASLESLTESSDRLPPSPPSTRRSPS
jgi:hypothetical protein